MHTASLKKCLHIAKANLKYNYIPHIGLSILILLITPAVFGVASLDAKAAAVPLEMFTALVGIILLTPVFMPEQQKEIRELVESRYTEQTEIYIIRIGISVLAMLITISCFVLFMRLNNCVFDISQYIIGTFAEGLFLGALGFFAYGISDNIAIGYMVPIVYYMLNLFGRSQNDRILYLFSMSQGSFIEKYWLLGCGALLIIITVFIKSVVLKNR